MKPKILMTTLLALSAALSLPASAGNWPSPRDHRIVVAPAPLSSAEAETLQWMREEEKLARDVYLELYSRWKLPEFQRIANSEQRHFDALGKQLTRYSLTDPALAFPGAFSRIELQDLYGQLIATGSQDQVRALTVGATIEDLDIADLLAAIDGTTNPTMKQTYENLLEGSKNHLRVFVSLLRNQGSDYVPSYIEAALFDAIIGP
jgi:hypothetical protein